MGGEVTVLGGSPRRDNRIVQAYLSPSAQDVVSALHARRYQAFVRLAVLLVDSEQSAEEIVQEAFVSLMRGWSRLRDEGAAEAYVRRAVINGARDRLRARRVRRLVRQPTEGAEPSAEDLVVRDENQRELLSELRRLPSRQREVLILRYFEGLSEREVADCLSISVGTVKSSAHKGIAGLRAGIAGGES